MHQTGRWSLPPPDEFAGSRVTPGPELGEGWAETPMTRREALWIAVFTAICVGAMRLAGL